MRRNYRYLFSIVMVLTLGMLVSSCGKKKKEDGKSKKAPAADVNKFKIKTTGKEKVTFEGTKQMQTAVWTTMGGYSMIAFVPEKIDGCPTINDLKGEMRVSVTMPKLDPEILKGKKPLPSTVKQQGGVILHKGFNRIFMGTFKKIGTVTFTTKTLKKGGFVEGTISIDGGDGGKYGYIKGNFKAKICKL